LAAVTPPRPLAESDDRVTFNCGRDSLNAWFRRNAWTNHVNGVSRVNVIADAATGKIVGYVTLSASHVERAFFPRSQQRNRPEFVPVTLLGQLGIDQAYQRQGHATSLLLFALKTAMRAADVVGSVGVLTRPLDDDLRRFYGRWGFQDLPYDPRQAMLVRMGDLKESLEAAFPD